MTHGLAILLLSSGLLRTQEPPSPVFRAETALVQLRFHVIGKDRYVTDLKPTVAAAPRKHNLEIRLRDKTVGEVHGGARTVVH